MGTARPWVGPMNLALFDLIWERAFFKSEWIVLIDYEVLEDNRENKSEVTHKRMKEVNDLLGWDFIWFCFLFFFLLCWCDIQKGRANSVFKSHCLCSCCTLTSTAWSCPCPFFICLFVWLIYLQFKPISNYCPVTTFPFLQSNCFPYFGFALNFSVLDHLPLLFYLSYCFSPHWIPLCCFCQRFQPLYSLL